MGRPGHTPQVQLSFPACLAVLLFFCEQALAQEVSGIPPAPTAVSPVEILRTDTRYPLASVNHSSGFVPAPEGIGLESAPDLSLTNTSTGLTPNFRKHSRYWLYSEVTNRTANKDWVLHISNFGFLQPAVLVKGPDGQQTHIFSNAGYRESTDINTIGRGVNITLEPGQTYQLVVELKANHAAWHPYIALMSGEEYDAWTTRMEVAFNVAVGIILGLITLGLICWMLTREAAFFWAVSSSLVMLTYYLEHSSVPAILWQWDYQRNALFWVLMSGIMATQLAFAASFLKISRQSGRWYRAFSGAALVTLAVCFASLLLSFQANMLLYAINYIVVAAVILGSGVAKVRAEGSYYIFYLLGWFPMVLSLLQVAAVTQGAQGATQTVDVSYKMIHVLYIQAGHMFLHAIALILRVRDLREEKLRAEFLSASKSRFIAQSSHDLSQPLNSMKLFLDHLKPHIQDASGNRIFQRLRRTHTQMSESFTSIMDLGKLESGSLPAEKKPLALSTLFARLAPEYTLLAHEKGIRLTVHPSTLHVTSDPALLERMLRNLLSNAIKYTDEGRVVMGCRRRGQSVLIDILDTGCGIEESARPAVFDIYHRSANTSDRTEGSGIGLSIVKHIADLLDHPVTFSSIQGKGSRFTVTLPRLPSAHGNPQTTTNREASAPGVLVVVEDNALRSELCERLKRWQCDIQTEESLASAIRTGTDAPILICDESALTSSTVSADLLLRLGDTAIVGCICSHELALPEHWITVSRTALPSQMRALLNLAARQQSPSEGTCA